MGILHSFVRLKSVEQIQAEGIVPFESNATGSHPIDTNREMCRALGNGQIYYVEDIHGLFRFEQATTGEVVSSRRIGLRLVIFDNKGRPVDREYCEISGFRWLPQMCEIISDMEWYFPYNEGDQVYINARRLIEHIGTDARYFHHQPCTVTEVDEEARQLEVKTSAGYSCTVPAKLVLGFVSEISSFDDGDQLWVWRCRRCGDKFGTDSCPDNPPELCPSCAKRFFVTPYHRYTPPLTFWAEDESNDPDVETGLYYGFELEIDGGGEDDSTAQEIVCRMNPDPNNPDHPWFMYCSHDGSLNRGMELISMPATITYHKSKREQYARLFQWLKKEEYLSHSTSTCGLHFHFSRAYFEQASAPEECVSKLLYLVERFWDELTIFSRRDYKSLARYAKKVDEDPDVFIRKWDKNNDHDGHYYSINISNENTIEFRMFRGTLNIDTFFATLELVDSLVRAARCQSLLELQRVSFEDLLPSSALKYYQTRVEMSKFEE